MACAYWYKAYSHCAISKEGCTRSGCEHGCDVYAHHVKARYNITHQPVQMTMDLMQPVKQGCPFNNFSECKKDQCAVFMPKAKRCGMSVPKQYITITKK